MVKVRFVGYGEDLHTYLVMGVNGKVHPYKYNASGCRFLNHSSGGQNPDAETPDNLSDMEWEDETVQGGDGDGTLDGIESGDENDAVAPLVQPITRSVLKMDLTIMPDFAYDAQTTETRGPIHNLRVCGRL